MSSEKTQIKIMIFLERLWLTAAILSIGVIIYFILTKDNDSALFFLGFFILSGLLFILRRKQRRRYQKQFGAGQGYEPGKKKS